MNKNLILILLTLALFIGATIEYSEGSALIGILLFVAAIVLLSRMDITKSPGDVKPKFYAAVGIFIIVFDIAYNYAGIGRSGINTLDSMALLFGFSLVARSIDNEQTRTLGTFGMYMSASFIALYLTFYVMLAEYLYRFDHFFVLMPSAYLIKAVGVPIEIVSTEIVRIPGVQENLLLKIGGPCSGLYSMFLLIGIVVGFSVTEGLKDVRKILKIVAVAAVVAYAANIIRVSALYGVAYLYGIDVMLTVHTHLGWILFAVTSVVIL